MRYIDADVLIDDLIHNRSFYPAIVSSAIKNTPTADVVGVVRCKDCKRWTKEKNGSQGRCGMYGHYPRDVFYCANGERREKNEG